MQVYDIIGGKRRLEQIEREKQMLAQEEWMPNRSPQIVHLHDPNHSHVYRAAREGAMRLSDDEEEDEDPVLRGKRLWKQWQQNRMQQNEDDGADGDEGCSAAESLLQALSKSKKLKRYRPMSASLSVDESLGDGSLRSSSGTVNHGAASDAAAAATMAPLVSAHIQQLTRTGCGVA